MISTQFRVEGVFGDIIGKYIITQGQISKPNSFFSQNDVNININVIFKFLHPERKKITLIFNQPLPSKLNFSVNINGFENKNLLCGRTA